MKKIIKFKKAVFIITLSLLVSAVSLAFLIYNDKEVDIARALIGDNVTGFAWNSNIGWISFNCTDDSCAGSDYGVHMDNDGNFSGYAWGNNIGWISFNETDLFDYSFSTDCENTCDAADTPCTACYNSTDNNIYGWAKILSLGDDGWISFNCSNDGSCATSNFNVSINASLNVFEGWAWNNNSNGAGIGWISFNCSNEASCATSDYHVDINFPPTVSNLTETTDYCGASPGVLLSWDFDDDLGNQQSYEIVIEKDGSSFYTFSDSSASTEFQLIFGTDYGGNTFDYNASYTWTVEAFDNIGQSSGVETSLPFTSLGPHPRAIVDHYTTDISADEEVMFEADTSEYWDGGGYQVCDGIPTCTWSWTSLASGVDIADASAPNTIVTFDDPGDSNDVVLLLTEEVSGNSYSCEVTTTLDVNLKLPQWIEN